jgi:hypothetical protein
MYCESIKQGFYSKLYRVVWGLFFKTLKTNEIAGDMTLKEGPLTKNGPIDFSQSWAIHMKKSD